MAAASSLDVPVALRAPMQHLDWSTRFASASVSLRGIPTGRIRASRQAALAQPTVTIVTPEDQATVPAGTLRVRGTVHANTPAVRVLVNGVRALVKGATFSAGVPVTHNTMVLTAVATTARGATARHQIGLTVRGPVEIVLWLRQAPGDGMAPLRPRFPLLSLPISTAIEIRLESDDEGLSFPRGEGRRLLSVGRGNGYRTALDITAGQPAGAAHVGGDPSAMALDTGLDRPQPAEQPRRRDVDLLDLHAGHEPEAEPQTVRQRGFLVQVADNLTPLRLVRSRDGIGASSFAGTRLGNEYSFVVFFIFEGDGLWSVGWF